MIITNKLSCNILKMTRAYLFLNRLCLSRHDVPPEYVLEIISYEYEYRNTYIYIDIYYGPKLIYAIHWNLQQSEMVYFLKGSAPLRLW